MKVKSLPYICILEIAASLAFLNLIVIIPPSIELLLYIVSGSFTIYGLLQDLCTYLLELFEDYSSLNKKTENEN